MWLYLILTHACYTAADARICNEETHAFDGPSSVNVSNISCPELYLLSAANGEKIANLIQADLTHKSVEYVKGLNLAHSHVIASLFSQRRDCVTESFRFAVMMYLRNLKNTFVHRSAKFVGDIASVSSSYLNSLSQSLAHLPADQTTAYYTHENDGRLTTLESLRIHTFREDEVSIERNLCLLRHSILNVFAQGDTVLDVGSGPNGVVSEWFNKTGIVTSYALDGSPSMEYVSAGKVAEADARNASSLVELVNKLGIEVDWIWCVDVLSSVTEEAASRIVETLFDGINPRKGIILVTDSGIENLSTVMSSSRYSLSGNASVCNRTEIQIFTLAW